MPSGKSKTSGSENGARREPAAVLLPDHRRVQALLDGRPDGEGRSEVVALDDEVRSVADADLVDLGEELVRRVAREHVGRAGLDPDADEREQPLVLPGRRALELVVAELDADLLVGVGRVRLGERHGHVEIRHAGLEARVEDGDVEQGVDGVEDGVRLGLADQGNDGLLARRVDRVRAEAPVVELAHEVLGAGAVVVRQGTVLEERAPPGDLREGRADTACSDDENPHGARVLHERRGL